MKIYTRTGDDGTTGLFGGARVKKNDARVEAYGTVDEANAAIGMARATGLEAAMDALLASIQDDLFTVGAELACAPGKEGKLRLQLIGAEDAVRLERAIDDAETGLAALRSFVLPAGSAGAAALHFARCVVRRAERRALDAAAQDNVRHELLVYLNRLSDLLFVLARKANHLTGTGDVPWRSRQAAT
jgi:cob(I)alamin adenosyltransferase